MLIPQDIGKLAGKLATNISALAVSLGTISCFVTEAHAASFTARIDNFSLLMPAKIENQFDFSLNNSNHHVSGSRAGSATNFSSAHSSPRMNQPNGLPSPPFSSVRLRQDLRLLAHGTASMPFGHAEAHAEHFFSGILENLTPTSGEVAMSIPLELDLSFDYDLTTQVNSLFESATAGFEIIINGFGTPDSACTHLTITANASQADTVNCTFSTVLAPTESRDFDFYIKAFGVADALADTADLPKTPEPSTFLGLGALALASGTLLRRKRQ